MMCFRKIAAAAKCALILRYFTKNTPDAARSLHPTRRAGSWKMATASPPTTQVATAGRQELSRLFEGRRADDSEACSQHRRKLSAFDIVFIPDKSVSLAAAVAPTDAERALIRNAVTGLRIVPCVSSPRRLAGRAKAMEARTVLILGLSAPPASDIRAPRHPAGVGLKAGHHDQRADAQ
jgi:hypothetical protein